MVRRTITEKEKVYREQHDPDHPHAKSEKETITDREYHEEVEDDESINDTTTHHHTHKDYHDLEATKKRLSGLVLFLIILFIIALAGFLITMPVDRVLVTNIPRDQLIIETTTTYRQGVENLDCKEPDYDVVDEEILDNDARRVTIRNNQDELWSFTVIANFTYANRTSSTVPPEREEVVQQSLSIGSDDTEEVILRPTSNATRYDNVFARITVLPEIKEKCDIELSSRPQIRQVNKTSTTMVPHTVNYVEEKHLWAIVFDKLRN